MAQKIQVLIRDVTQSYLYGRHTDLKFFVCDSGVYVYFLQTFRFLKSLQKHALGSTFDYKFLYNYIENVKIPCPFFGGIQVFRTLKLTAKCVQPSHLGGYEKKIKFVTALQDT